MVSCRSGLVLKGSLLSYQSPIINDNVAGNVILLREASPPPLFTFPNLLPVSENSVNMFCPLNVSKSMSHESEDWHRLRKNMITASNLKRVCCRRGHFNTLADQLLASQNIFIAAIKFGIENEPTAAYTHARNFGTNVYCMGFINNPTCCFLSASPDKRVCYPDAKDG
jgi:YqaJ-like viral recombinase domain